MEATEDGVATGAGCTAMTNGHVGGSSPESDSATVTKTQPTIIEAFRSSENFGENSSDVEKFASKLTEMTDIGDKATTKEKQYEESALKAMTEKSDDSELSSTTEMTLDQKQKVKTSDTGAVTSQFAENQEKKHELATSSTDRIGDNITATVSTSEKSHEKSSMSVETSEEGPNTVLFDVGSDSASNSLKETKGENFSSSRKVERSKSEQQFQYSTSDETNNVTDGGGSATDKAGKVDYSKRFDDLFDQRGEYRRQRPRSYDIADSHGGLEDVDRDAGQSYSSRSRQVGFRDQVEEFGIETGVRSEHARPDLDLQSDYALGSRSSQGLSQHYYGTSRSLDDELEGPDRRPEYGTSWGVSSDRKTADDLVRRILSESRVGGGGRGAVYEDDRRLPPPPSASLRGFEERSFSPTLPAAGRRERIKVDMADGGIIDNSTTMAERDDLESEMKRHAVTNEVRDELQTSSSLASDSMEFAGSERTGRLMEERLPPLPLRPAPRDQEMSLLDRRLASMGFDKKLNQQVVLGDSGGAICGEGYVETTYISKKKPPGLIAGDADELDEEINKLRSNYRENLERRNRILYDDFGEDERRLEERPPPPPLATAGYIPPPLATAGYIPPPLATAGYIPPPLATAGYIPPPLATAGYIPRGRMVRQGYVEDGEDVPYDPPPRPPKKPSLPDEAFIPKRRAETEEVVKEKSKSIREMVERQSGVLEKLREASNSFDDLSEEVKAIKQQLAANQTRRTFTMSDEFDQGDEEDSDAGPPDYGSYGGSNYEYKGYVSRAERARLEREQEEEDTGRPGSSYRDRQYGALDDTYVPYVPLKQRYDTLSRSMSTDDYGEVERRGRNRFDYQDDDDVPGYGSTPTYSSGGYSSVSSYSSSITSSSYKSKPTFTRANTLSDFNFDRPSVGSYGGYSRSDRYDRPSSFSSRFLDKVRDRKQSGETPGGQRDKPFKSRFLRDTFTPSSGDASSSYVSRSSNVSSVSSSQSVSTSGAGTTDATPKESATTPETKPAED